MQRRALITGASSGIGAATAIMLADQGYEVWLTYSTGEAAVRSVAERCSEHGTRAQVSRLDLRDPDSISELTWDLCAIWGELHVLVNNGGTCPYADFAEITVDDWDAVLETNARGTFLMTRSALPLLRRARERGDDCSIVNLSSIAGEVGAIKTGMHYAASKAAILALTRSFAKALAEDRIRVNAVCPGPVSSNITDQLSPEGHADLEAGIPLGRFGEPAEVAWIIAALASPQASFITGATYDVNGGVRIDQ
jgi:3-oxoacyl-[acyl-carrier protein] reductase